MISSVVTIPMYLYALTAADYPTIASLDRGGNRTIVLSTASLCEVTCPFYYQVFAGTHEVVPQIGVFLDDITDRLPYDIYRLTYTLVTANNKQLVAIVPAEFPYTPIVIHDFETGDSWPRHDEKYAVLRGRLEQEHPEISATAKIADTEYMSKIDFLDLGESAIRDQDLASIAGLVRLRTLYLA